MSRPRIKRFEVIRDIFSLKRLADRMMKIEEFAFDTETNSLRCLGPNKDFRFVGLSISWGAYNNYYIPTGHIFDDNQVSIKMLRKYLKPVFERTDVRIIGWNLKFDMHVLARIGIYIKTKDLFDGMIASWLVDVNTPNGLKENVELIFHIKQGTFKETVSSVTTEEKKSVGLKGSQNATFDMVHIDVAAPYALDDSFFTWELYLHFDPLLDSTEMRQVFERTYRRYLYTLFEQEEYGVIVDIPKLKKMGEDMEKDLERLTYEILEIAGIQFNPGSSQQVAELLFGFHDPAIYKNPNASILEQSFHFPVPSFTPKGAPQSSSKSLEEILSKEYKNVRKIEGQELVKKLLVLKKLQKLKSAFVDGIQEQMYDDGKVHPSFNIIGTTSGRLSCIAEGSLIDVVNGKKPIEEIVAGDLVYNYAEDKSVRISKVKRLIDNGIQPCVKIVWRSTGTHKEGELVCTPDHKILLTTGEWVRADSLKPSDKVVHLRRSSERRPRLYGWGSSCYKEQDLIRDQILDPEGKHKGKSVHHLDRKPWNNDPSNLTLMSKAEHTRLHSKLAVAEGKIKYKHLYDGSCKRVILSGKANGRYIEVSALELEKMVIDAKGIIRNIPMDFDTFKKKCVEVGFDYKKVASRYQIQYNNPTIEEFSEAYQKFNGVAYLIRKALNIGRVKYEKLLSKYEVCPNHSVVSVEFVGLRHVYDLEVEGIHNFIASEICVHNCSEPNLQQLPRSLDEDDSGLYELVAKYHIRDIFMGSIDNKTGRRKKIVALDYKNLEMMILAHFSEDHELMDTFTSGGDAHNSTAKKMFNLECDVKDVKKLFPLLRQVAKTINFGLMYGMQAYTLYNTLKDNGIDLGDPKYLKEFGVKKGEEVAQIYIDKYFEVYAGVAKYIRDQKKFAHRNECVYTLTGRRRSLPDINSRDYKLAAYSERLSVNAPVQGSAGDVAINAQLRVSRDKILPELGCVMLIQVHDELVFECPEENLDTVIPRLQHLMEYPFGDKVSLNVQLKAEAGYGDSYDEAK